MVEKTSWNAYGDGKIIVKSMGYENVTKEKKDVKWKCILDRCIKYDIYTDKRSESSF